ncbi:MAG: hypothetical protein QM756_15640 [Polyangiaceae bacterium]
MSSLHHSLRAALLLSFAALSVAASAPAQPRLDGERAELQRQLNESRERVKRLEERLRLLDARRAQTSKPSASLATNCGTPFYLDTDGVKHFRTECAAQANAPTSAPACSENPFTIDEQGIKRIRPACQREN